MSTGQGRHAGRHDGTGASLLILAAIFAAVALLALAAITARTAGPVTGAPGPRVTATMPAGPQVTARPDAEAGHAAHLAHLAHARREHAAHAEHEAHLAHLRHVAGLP